MTCSELKVL